MTALSKTFPSTPLRGVNLGSWLNLEDFMFGLEGTDWQIRRAFAKHLGEERADAFFSRYRKTFVTKEDIREIARLGFNSVRVPFNYRYFEDDGKPFHYREEGFAPLDWLYETCEAAGLGVLLDFHAAPRGQNTTPPADCPTGYNELWQDAQAQDRVVALWEALARRYHRHPAHFGYNLLNEPMVNQPGELTPNEQTARLNALCHRLVTALRTIDPEGWIVIEGPVRESGGIEKLDRSLFRDPRTIASYHHYPLFEDSLGLITDRIPAGTDQTAQEEFLRRRIAPEVAFAQEVGRPMLLGEFGLSARWEPEQAEAIFAAQLATAEEAGFSWMLWTYKDLWRLGLFTPKASTPWSKFVRDPKLLDEISSLQRALQDFFGEKVRAALPEACSDRLLRDAAFDDLRRGQNRLLLDHQLRLLAALPEETVNAMPDSFALAHCERREPIWKNLAPYLGNAGSR